MTDRLCKKAIEGQTETFEAYIDTKDDGRLYFLMKYSPARDENRNIIGVIVTAVNTTDLRRSEENEKRARNLLLQAESISHIGSFEFVWDTGMSQWSAEFARICGIDELYYANARALAFELIHPDDILEVENALANAIQTGEDFKAAFRICRKDGNLRFVECLGRVEAASSDTPASLVGIMKDVTETKATEQRLLQTMRTLNERAKQHACLYEITNLSNYSYSIEVLLQRVIDLLPSGFQYPEGISACISFDGNETCTKGYSKSQKEIRVAKKVIADKTLELMVWYHEDGNRQFDFLAEEFSMVDTIANNLTLHLAQIINHQKLQAGREELRKIMDSSPDMVCTMNSKGIWQKVGAGSRALLGYEPHELEGRNYLDFILPGQIDSIDEYLEQTAGMGIAHTETEFWHKDGYIVTIYWNTRWDEKDNLFYAIGRDARRLKAVEKVLRSEKERYAELFRNAPAFICILSGSDYVVEFNNPPFEHLAGTNDVVGKSVFEFLLFEKDEHIRKRLRELDATGETITEGEVAVRTVHRPDKPARFINFVAHPYRNSEGEAKGIIIYGIDISIQIEAKRQLEASVAEKLLAQKQLQQVNKSLDQLLQSTAEGIFGVDREGKCTFINRSGAWMLGYPPSACVGRSLHELIHHTRPDGSPCNGEHCAFNEAIAARSGVSVEQDRFWRSDGHSLPVRFTCNAIVEDGEHVGAVVAFSDISEQLTAQRALQRLQANQEALINSTNDFVWSVDAEYRLITANRTFLNYMKELTGKDLKRGDDFMMLDVFPEESLEYWQALYDRCLEGDSYQAEVHTDKGTPNETWLEVQLNPIFGAERVIGIACFSRNVTEAKKNEAKFMTMNRRLETAQQIARLGYWELNLKNGTMFWTREVYTIWGVDSESFELTPKSFFSTIHPEDREPFIGFETRKYDDDKKIEIEHRIILPDGSIRYIHEIAEIVRNEDGEAIRVEGTAQDITERTLALQRLEESEAQYRYLFLMSPLPKCIYDIQTMQIYEVNEATIKKYGYSREAFLKMTILDVIPEEDWERVKAAAQSAVKGATVNFGQWRHIKADGETLYMEVAGHIMTQFNRDVIMSVAMDVTERVKITGQLEELNRELITRTEELASSNVELERFAYVASHDLQEPLRMVSSFLQLLKKKYHEQVDETGQAYIDFAVNGADRMKQLIKDLLEYSRLDSKSDEPDETDMGQVMQEVIYTLGDRIRQANATVDVGPLPVIIAHRTQMFQLLQNLVSNGLKYNDQPHPKVSVNALDQSDHWLFEIHDNGIGIEERHYNKIFAIFQRLHTRSQYSGTGIGLSVCKKIVERAGGSIWVQSKPGSGSTFYFTIPKIESMEENGQH
ncbi:MAG: PAS domain S-box protein [Chitinophagaceae bacterium]|nr:PAS domain S-box protein [Chitinophagaceae bacterium]